VNFKSSKPKKPVAAKSLSRPFRSKSTGLEKQAAPKLGSNPSDIGRERLQKVLAREGLGSRRDLERHIFEGQALVNGKVASLGDKVSPGDKIVFQGREIFYQKSHATPQIMVYHKPAGEICTQKDPEGRPSVFDRLPACSEGRWVMVGRLDFNSSGLLMFTNSGELANQLMHPRYQIEREYAVRIFGELSEEHMDRLLKGVRLEDGMARFLRITFAGGEGKNHWYHVVLTEGRNREIRRMFEEVGFTVSRLIRIRFGTVALPPTLVQGKRALLPDNQVLKLMSLLEPQPFSE
jgi:23S rRNA pseudouridine2605 synthase